MGAALDVGAWLQALGLPQYERAFRENAVDEEVLPELGETDLEKLGVLLGHRKRILKALAELRSATAQRPRARAEAERRQLTVMFVDLVGSTALAERLDPEEVREVIRDYQNIVSGEVARLEGQIAQFIGDGVLAYFGWPQAHEDEAERAVRAGLAIASAVGTVSVPGGHPLACRVGIATGLVVVGDLVGRPEAPVRTVVGGTPNMAARLQQAAPANAVVVDETVRRLIGCAFELESMGPLTLKGIEAPVAAYRVHRQSAVAGRFDAH